MPEVTEDGTLYTMRVKPGIYFADDAAFKGKKRELTAEDYVYSIKRIFDPRRSRPTSTSSRATSPAWTRSLAKARKAQRIDYDTPVEGLRALDRYTFQIRLKQPNYNFLYYLAYCNVSCARGARGGRALRRQDRASTRWAPGPYRLAFWKRSSKMVFEAQPELPRGVLRRQPAGRRRDGAGDRCGATRASACRWWTASRSTSSRSRSRATSRSSTTSTTSSSACPTSSPTSPSPTTQLAADLARRGIRMERKPGHGAHLLVLRDEGSGRRRLHAGEDRAAPRDRRSARTWAPRSRIARKNQAIPAQSPIGPGAAGYDPDFRSTATEYNPAKSKALLDMYGYVDCNGDGWRDLPRKAPGDECKPFAIEYASAPDARSRSRWTRTGRRTWTPSAST